MTLAQRFLAWLIIPEPYRSGIKQDAYLEILKSNIDPVRLNNLLLTLIKAIALNRAQKLEIIRDNLNTLFKPSLKGKLFVEFKKGNEIWRQVQAAEKNSVSYNSDDLDNEELQKLRQKYPGKEDIDLYQIFLKEPASEEFLLRRSEKDFEGIKYHLPNKIVEFLDLRLPIIYAEIDSKMTFKEKLVVVGYKKEFSQEQIFEVVRRYETEKNIKRYSAKSYKTKFSEISTLAKATGYYDLINEDDIQYQKYFKKLYEDTESTSAHPKRSAFLNAQHSSKRLTDS